MNHSHFCFALVFALVGLGMANCTEVKQSEKLENQTTASTPVKPKDQTNTSPQSWNEWIVIKGNHYVPVVDEVGRNIRLARENFLRMDFKSAETETRKAAAILQEELGTGSREEKVQIKAAIRDLDRLADQLDQHTVESLDQMDIVLDKALEADLEHTWKVVGVERWTPLAEAANAHLQLAQQELLKKDFKDAAAEIRKVVGLLRLEAVRSFPEEERELLGSGGDLELLAGEVEKGALSSVKGLDSSFAAAQYALAESHYQNALRDWAMHDSAGTGHELSASVLDLSAGADWAGRGAEFDSALVVKDAMALSSQLIEGSYGDRTEIAQEIRSVGNEIESLRKGVQLQAGHHPSSQSRHLKS